MKKIWLKRLALALLIIAGLTGWALVGVSLYSDKLQAENAAERSRAVKDDRDLIGQRFEVPRDGKTPVSLNLYQPAQADPGQARPLIINIHGGGFVYGDADMLDTQSQRLADSWGATVLAIDYTKADVQPIDYEVEEIADVVRYAQEHSDYFRIDPNNTHLMGYSAGAFYVASATQELIETGTPVASQILVVPWTDGLDTDLPNNLPPTLFVLGGNDPISQRSTDYQNRLKEAGAPVEVIEYPAAQHPFMDTINPEFATTVTPEEVAQYQTPEQQEAAHQAEKAIGSWIQEKTKAQLAPTG